MKRLLFAALMLCAPVAAHAQFSFNRVSCIVSVIDACVHVDATFNPGATGTYISMRLNVAQTPAAPGDMSAIALYMLWFDKGPGNSSSPVYAGMPWISTYGNVQGATNLQSNVPAVETYDNLVLFDFQRYVGGCTQWRNFAEFQTCDSQFGFGALEFNFFTPHIYSSDILTRVNFNAFGDNASGELVGIGCSMAQLGVAQGLGSYVAPPQTGPNSCDTAESNQSLAIGPRTILTTPEPSTWSLMLVGMTVIVVARWRARR